MHVSVILATYNRASSLQKTLETFSALSCPAELLWELLVIDNNSSDGTREVVQQFAKTAKLRVRYIFEKRQGRSAALNAGIAAAKGEIIAFTDDDVLLHSDWLLNLKHTFDRFDCAGVGGRIVPLWNHPRPEWLEMDGQQAVVNFELGDEFREISFAPMGANSAFRREMFTKCGLFRLDLGVSGSEHTVTCDDTEFGDRVLKAGEKNRLLPHRDHLSSRRPATHDQKIFSVMVLLQWRVIDPHRRAAQFRDLLFRSPAVAVPGAADELRQLDVLL